MSHLIESFLKLQEDTSGNPFQAAKSLDEKHEGFKKLDGELSHEKGVKDPAALAAAIGRKKYGAKNFNKHAEEGKKLKEEEQIDELAGKGALRDIAKHYKEKRNSAADARDFEAASDHEKKATRANRMLSAHAAAKAVHDVLGVKVKTDVKGPKYKATTKEEVEEIDEISKAKAQGYLDASETDTERGSDLDKAAKAGDKKAGLKLNNRLDGQFRAKNKIAGDGTAKVNATEEAEVQFSEAELEHFKKVTGE